MEHGFGQAAKMAPGGGENISTAEEMPAYCGVSGWSIRHNTKAFYCFPCLSRIRQVCLMPSCPECSCLFPRIENIIPRFRPKPCPRCGTRVKPDPDRFPRGVMILWLFGNAFLSTFNPAHWGMPAWLNLTREQFIYGWGLLCFIAYYATLFFGGGFIRYQPQPPFREQLKKALTYEPMYPNLKFKWSWLMPMGFFISLMGLVAGLIIIANRIAHLQ